MKKFFKFLICFCLFVTVVSSTLVYGSEKKYKLSRTSMTLHEDYWLKLKLSDLAGNAPKWKTSNKQIATVTKWGTVHALKPGTVTISATYKYKTYTCKITILRKDDYSNLIFNKCNASDKVMNSIKKYYLAVPIVLREHFEADGYKIECYNNLNKKYGYSFSIRGVTDYVNMRVGVDNRLAATESISHELGHYLDYELNWASGSSAFEIVKKENKDTYIRNFSTHRNNTATYAEFFAQSFSSYLQEPDKLKKVCPSLYTYFDKLIDSLEIVK